MLPLAWFGNDFIMLVRTGILVKFSPLLLSVAGLRVAFYISQGLTICSPLIPVKPVVLRVISVRL
jgi:hypothetical protein